MKFHPISHKNPIFNASNGGGQINKKLVKALNRQAKRKERDYEPEKRSHEEQAYA